MQFDVKYVEFACFQAMCALEYIGIKCNVSVKNTTILLHKMLFQGDIFRLFLSHLQVLQGTDLRLTMFKLLKSTGHVMHHVYVCMFVCMCYVCIYVCMYVCMCVCM